MGKAWLVFGGVVAGTFAISFAAEMIMAATNVDNKTKSRVRYATGTAAAGVAIGLLSI